MRYQHRFKAMGGPCQLRLDHPDETIALAAISAAEAEVKRLEQKYSRYLDDSVLSSINNSAGTGSAIAIDGETHSLLQYAQTLHEQSDGAFDITSGVLRKAWNFRSTTLPGADALAPLLPLIGWDKVVVTATSISLPVAGMELDFGGFAKEYACDAAARVLRDGGIEHGLVDLAGDFSVFGGQVSGEPWTINVRRPPQPQANVPAAIARVELHNGALATSGDYERCIQIDGKRYGHILDPRSGMPVAGFASVSVIAPQCLVAGSAATIALLKTEQDASQWLQELGLAWLAVDHDQVCHGSLNES